MMNVVCEVARTLRTLDEKELLECWLLGAQMLIPSSRQNLRISRL